MRKTTLLLGAAATAIAAPAMARDGEGYFGAEYGVVFPDDYDSDIGNIANAATTSGETGWELGGVLGYDFGPVRTEVEGSYREWDVDQITSDVAGVTRNRLVPVTGTFPYGGEMRMTSVMANVLADIGGNDSVGFSAGAGYGHVWLGADTFGGTGASPQYLDDEDHAWAWQALAELRFPVTDAADLGLKYRYVSTSDFTLTDALGRDNTFDLETHSVLLTLRFNFGGAEEVIPVPVAAPIPEPAPQPVRPVAPTPQPVRECQTGPYIVFFDWDQSNITPEAASVLNAAVTAYGDCGTARVMLAGHTDRSGSVPYNMGLAERRNASVQSYLTGRGIPAARISTEAFGESMPRVPTADGVRELQNRRVEVTYGPGSGM